MVVATPATERPNRDTRCVLAQAKQANGKLLLLHGSGALIVQRVTHRMF